MKTSWVVLVSLMFLSACESKPGYHASEYKEIKVEELSDDVKIPSKAWNMIEFRAEETHAEAADHGEEKSSGTAGNTVGFAEVTVFIVQKNEDIVEGERVKISLPKGGGTIDLSRYIAKDKKGSFFVGFEFPKFSEAAAKKVIFVSHARKRKIGDQVFGAGCNQILDITEKFSKEMLAEGLKLNTTQERYISVIGGTFLFSAQQGKDVHIAQVTFTNPQFQHLFCEEK